jgi:hypothetical protein
MTAIPVVSRWSVPRRLPGLRHAGGATRTGSVRRGARHREHRAARGESPWAARVRVPRLNDSRRRGDCLTAARGSVRYGYRRRRSRRRCGRRGYRGRKAKTTGTPRRRVLAGVIVGKHRGQLSRPWVQVAARDTEVIGRGCRGIVEVERIGCLVAAGVDAVARPRGRVELHRTECAVGAGITVEPTMIGVVYDLKCHCHGAACRC